MIEFRVTTTSREELIDITSQVAQAISTEPKKDGLVVVYIPHTTAGLTINENADPDVVTDILYALDKTAPNHSAFRHAEGNSTAHVKTSLMGSSVQVILENGSLVLGTWQSIFFCEFDGPRNRKVLVKVL